MAKEIKLQQHSDNMDTAETNKIKQIQFTMDQTIYITMDPFKEYYKTIPSGNLKKVRYREFIKHNNFESMKHFYHVDPLVMDAGNFVKACDCKNHYKNNLFLAKYQGFNSKSLTGVPPHKRASKVYVHSIIQHLNYQQMKQYYHVSPMILDAGNFVKACDRKNAYKNSVYNDED